MGENQMAQHNTAVHERLTAHDEHRRVLQAECSKLGADHSEQLGKHQETQRRELQNLPSKQHIEELRLLLGEHRSDLDRRLASEKASREQHALETSELLAKSDKSLRRELQKLADDRDAGHSQLREQLEHHRNGLLQQLGTEKVERDTLREVLQSLVTDREKTLRRELQQHAEEYQGSQSRMKELLHEHKSEHKTTVQSLLADLQQLRDEHRGNHAKFYSQLEEHRITAEKARDEHRILHTEALAQLELQLRKDLQKLSDDHQSGHLALRDLQGEHRSQHEQILQEHKADLIKQVENVEKDLRRELQRTGDAHQGYQQQFDEHRTSAAGSLVEIDSELRKAIARMSDDHSGKHSSTLHAVEALDAEIRLQLSRHSDEHSGKLARLQDLLDEHRAALQREMGLHQDGLREFLQQEKAERFRHHTSLQERIDVLETSQNKEDEDIRGRLKASLEQPTGISRGEFDEEVHRLWQAIDTHTHSIQEEPKTLVEVVDSPQTRYIEEPVVMQTRASVVSPVVEFVPSTTIVEPTPAPPPPALEPTW